MSTAQNKDFDPGAFTSHSESASGTPPRAKLASVPGTKTKRVTMTRTNLRLHPDVKQRVEYWSDRHGLTANEYMSEAVIEAIRRENQDYDLPTLEIARLNQVVDEVKALSSNVANLERVLIQGFDSLLGLTRGDNYLLDDENGELP